MWRSLRCQTAGRTAESRGSSFHIFLLFTRERLLIHRAQAATTQAGHQIGSTNIGKPNNRNICTTPQVSPARNPFSPHRIIMSGPATTRQYTYPQWDMNHTTLTSPFSSNPSTSSTRLLANSSLFIKSNDKKKDIKKLSRLQLEEMLQRMERTLQNRYVQCMIYTLGSFLPH